MCTIARIFEVCQSIRGALGIEIGGSVANVRGLGVDLGSLGVVPGGRRARGPSRLEVHDL